MTATTRPSFPMALASTPSFSWRGVSTDSPWTSAMVRPHSLLGPTASTSTRPLPSVTCAREGEARAAAASGKERRAARSSEPRLAYFSAEALGRRTRGARCTRLQRRRRVQGRCCVRAFTRAAGRAGRPAGRAHLRARQHPGVPLGVSALLHGVTLSGEGRLVDDQAMGLDHQTVGNDLWRRVRVGWGGVGWGGGRALNFYLHRRAGAHTPLQARAPGAARSPV